MIRESTKIKVVEGCEKINVELRNIFKDGKLTRLDVKCKCCGYEWTPLLTHVAHKTDSGNPRGCPNCAKSGYNSAVAGTFYVVQWTHPVTGHSFLKYGISNNHVQRFKQQQRGTEYVANVLFAKTYENGKVAQDLERMCHEKRDSKSGIIDSSLFADGYTETMKIENYDWLNKLVDFELNPLV